jgi:dissimilatory sulfite reductase (desulfoviridin) alpha/beta subunit
LQTWWRAWITSRYRARSTNAREELAALFERFGFKSLLEETRRQAQQRQEQLLLM